MSFDYEKAGKEITELRKFYNEVTDAKLRVDARLRQLEMSNGADAVSNEKQFIMEQSQRLHAMVSFSLVCFAYRIIDKL